MRILPFIILQGCRRNKVAESQIGYENYTFCPGKDINNLLTIRFNIGRFPGMQLTQEQGAEHAKKLLDAQEIHLTNELTEKYALKENDHFIIIKNENTTLETYRECKLNQAGYIKLIEQLCKSNEVANKRAALWLQFYDATYILKNKDMVKSFLSNVMEQVNLGFIYPFTTAATKWHVGHPAFRIASNIQIEGENLKIDVQMHSIFSQTLVDALSLLIGRKLRGGIFHISDDHYPLFILLEENEYSELRKILGDKLLWLLAQGEQARELISEEKESIQASQEQPNAELKRNKNKEGEEKYREDKSTLTRTLGSAVDKLFGKSSILDQLFNKLDLPTDEEIITGFEDAADDLDDKLNIAYDRAQIMLSEASQNVDEVVTNALASLEHFKASWHVNRAKKKLQKIFTRPDRDYSEKSDLIESVRKIVTSVKDLNALAQLYVFINLPENKDKLNIHRSPVKDTLLLNHNTASWQKLLDQIREHAFTRLLNKAKITQQQCTLILAGQDVNPPLEDLEGAKKVLKIYSKEPIFCQHHSNKNFFNLFHSTNTSGKIKDLINYYKIECEKIKKLKERIYN